MSKKTVIQIVADILGVPPREVNKQTTIPMDQENEVVSNIVAGIIANLMLRRKPLLTVGEIIKEVCN